MRIVRTDDRTVFYQEQQISQLTVDDIVLDWNSVLTPTIMHTYLDKSSDPSKATIPFKRVLNVDCSAHTRRLCNLLSIWRNYACVTHVIISLQLCAFSNISTLWKNKIWLSGSVFANVRYLILLACRIILIRIGRWVRLAASLILEMCCISKHWCMVHPQTTCWGHVFCWSWVCCGVGRLLERIGLLSFHQWVYKGRPPYAEEMTMNWAFTRK